ncbi:MAG: Tetratricopeptide 2 repeat protein [Acidobacteria bacterium]|nr:Tetratricopeptide 2 repeat protein [Acidobacteriota bacterium]
MAIAFETGDDGAPVLRVGARAVPFFPLLAGAAALAATANVLFNGWTLDAEVDILANRLVRGPVSALPALLASDYTAGSNLPSGFWRPVVLLCYWVLWRLGLGTPIAFFAANIVLHAGISIGVYHLARRLGAAAAAALAGALLFAVHPVHADVTAGVVGLKDLLAAAGFVGGYLLVLEARAAAAAGDGHRARSLTAGGLAAFLAGVLSKESALALLPCVALIDLGGALMQRGEGRAVSRRGRRAGGKGLGTAAPLVALQYAGMLAVVAIKFGLQRALLGGTIERVAIDPVDNPLSLLPALESRLQALSFIPFYFRLLVWPARLAPDYSYDAMPLAASAMPPAAWLGLALGVAVLAGAILALVRRERFLLATIVLGAATYLPVSNLVITLGTNAAERFLYLPSIGFCLAVGWGVGRLAAGPRPGARLAWGVLALLVVLGIVRSDLRNRDWADKYTLWNAAHEVVPRNLKVVLNLSQHLLARGEVDRALAMLDGALAQQDPLPTTQPLLAAYRPLLKSQRAAALAQAGRGAEARALFAEAIAEAPEQPDPRIRLARLLNREGKSGEALEQLDAVLRLDLTTAELARVEEEKLVALAALEPGGADEAVRRAVRLALEGPLPEAEALARSLAAAAPDRALPPYLLGFVERRMGRLDAAREAWRAARARAAAGSPLAAEIDRQLSTLPR